MADRTVVLATNGRHSVRGLTVVNPQEFAAFQEQDDELTYTFDLTSYLDGATISSVTRQASGPTVTSTSNTTTQIVQRLKGFGFVDIKVITSSGDTEEFRLRINSRSPTQIGQDAQVPIEMPVAFTSTSDPTANDDSLDGHLVGTLWINTATLNEFTCVTNTAAAARWRHRARALAHSFVASAAHTGTTSETAIATISLLAAVIGANGWLEITTMWACNNNANAKTPRVRFGGIAGTSYELQAMASNVSQRDLTIIANRNSQGSQIGRVSGQGAGGYGVSTAAPQTGAIDTSIAQTIVLTAQLANAGDNMTLEGYSVTLKRPDIT